MIRRLKEIYEYRDMVISLVQRELRGRYKGSALGFLWTFINPLCQIIIYTMVFSTIMRSGLDKFYIYMSVGMIPWVFFSTCIGQGAGCIRSQADMVKKIYFPREVLPISFVTSSFVNMLLSYLIVFCVILVTGYGVEVKLLVYLPLIMICEYMLALGITLVAAGLTVYFRDIEHITSVVLMAWIYITPIMYDISIVPKWLLPIFNLNPMTPIIMAYHDVLYFKQAPDMSVLFTTAGVDFVVLVLGMIIFAKLEKNFAEEM